MKPFNLEEYLKNPSRKVVTRGGKNVRIVCTDVKSELYPVLALVDNGYEEICYCYTKEGRFLPGNEAHRDLFFASENKEKWINLYYDKIRNNVYFGKIFKTKEKAKKMGKSQNNYVITIPIKWEE